MIKWIQNHYSTYPASSSRSPVTVDICSEKPWPAFHQSQKPSHQTDTQNSSHLQATLVIPLWATSRQNFFKAGKEEKKTRRQTLALFSITEMQTVLSLWAAGNKVSEGRGVKLLNMSFPGDKPWCVRLIRSATAAAVLQWSIDNLEWIDRVVLPFLHTIEGD